jgi:sugar phosphate isomerase/epimerase
MAEPLALGVITALRPTPLEALTTIRELGIPTAQVSYPGELDNQEGVRQIQEALSHSGIEITTVFCGFAGESYADIPTVKATVGLVPEHTRAERVARIRQIGEFARKLGVARVAAHIGFIPEDAADRRYEPLVTTVRNVCDHLETVGCDFALETGQETATTLQRFIGDVGSENLRVNFDPANMILYGNEDPIAAMQVLRNRIDGVHCKDGRWPTQPDQLGLETPLGEGDVNVPLWIEKLLETGYRGPLTIEREIAGEEQHRDILHARQLLLNLLAQHHAH